MDCCKIVFSDSVRPCKLKPKKIVIIGSGVAGLAASIRLAARGYNVHIYEKEEHAGGKVSWIEKDGYKWGLGASLLTFPHLIDDLFYLCKKNPADYYRYFRLAIIKRYFYPDGTIINAYADKEKFASEIENKTKDKASTVLHYLSNIEQLYNLSEPVILEKSLHKWRTYFSKSGLNLFLTSPFRLGLFTKLHKKNSNTFTDEKTIQLFDRYATYNGSNPYLASSIMCVVAHPEFNKGGFMMEDGMPSVTQNLYKLAKEMGVQFHFNSQVESILAEKKQAVGIRVGGIPVYADAVISNMDIQFTYSKLLNNIPRPKRFLEQEQSTSAIIFYWGMNSKFPELDVHNILFSDNYKKEFEAIAKGDIYVDPTIYIFISSKLNKNHAQPNGENWFTLINVPHDQGQNWNLLVEKFRKIIIQKISKLLKTDISNYIVAEVVNHPLSIELRTASFQGAIYGNASNKVFSAFQRHPNFKSDISNLYFCGGSVHPGGGVPISLLSAKITDELIS